MTGAGLGDGPGSSDPDVGFEAMLDDVRENPTQFRGRVPALVEVIDDGGPTEQTMGALLIGALSEEEAEWILPAADTLIDLLDAPVANTRKAALLPIRNLASDYPDTLAGDLSKLTRLFHDDDPDIQELAANALMSVNDGDLYDGITRDLVVALDHENDVVRDRAATCLHVVARANTEALVPYADTLFETFESASDDTPWLRLLVPSFCEHAILHDAGREVALGRLADWIDDSREHTRKSATTTYRDVIVADPDVVRTLRSTYPRVIPALQNRFEERVSTMLPSGSAGPGAHKFVLALGYVGDEDAVSTLESVAENDAVDAETREAARDAIERIQYDGAIDDPIDPAGRSESAPTGRVYEVQLIIDQLEAPPDDPAQCLKLLQELADYLQRYEVEDPAHEELVESVSNLLDNVKIIDDHTVSSAIDEDLQEQIRLQAHRAGRLYMRNSS